MRLGSIALLSGDCRMGKLPIIDRRVVRAQVIAEQQENVLRAMLPVVRFMFTYMVGRLESNAYSTPEA